MSNLNHFNFCLLEYGLAVPYIDCPTDIMVDAESELCQANVSYNVTANCGKSSPTCNITCDPPSGCVFNYPRTDVTCTAEDTNGREASCHFVVYIIGNALINNFEVND